MKVKRIIKGFEYEFKVYPILRTMTAEVRLMGRSESIICQITGDFQNVIIPETYNTFESEQGMITFWKIEIE